MKRGGHPGGAQQGQDKRVCLQNQSGSGLTRTSEFFVHLWWALC